MGFSFSSDIESELTSRVAEFTIGEDGGSHDDFEKGMSFSSGDDDLPTSELNFSSSDSGNFGEGRQRKRSDAIINKVKRSISMSSSKSSSNLNISGSTSASGSYKPRSRTLKKTNSIKGSFKDRLEVMASPADPDDPSYLEAISTITSGHC